MQLPPHSRKGLPHTQLPDTQGRPLQSLLQPPQWSGSDDESTQPASPQRIMPGPLHSAGADVHSLDEQIGALAGQWLSTTHSTHSPRSTSQIGSATPQSAFDSHATHCLVTDEQMGSSFGQSVPSRQPTQAPVSTSQMGSSPSQSASVSHDG
jgi:hypothetical protein